MALNARRNADILAFYKANKWSYTLVGDKFGVSRNVVSGIVFRDTYPVSVRLKRCGKPNKIGTGHHGRHHEPKYTIRNSDMRSARQVRGSVAA